MRPETKPSQARALRCTTLASVDTSRFMIARQAGLWLVAENRSDPDGAKL